MPVLYPQQVAIEDEFSENAASSVALPGGGWVVVWQSEAGAFMTWFNAKGQRVGDDRHISDLYYQTSQVALLSDGSFIVTFAQNDEIHQQRFASDGAMLGQNTLVSIPTETEGAVRSAVTPLSNGGWIVVVEERDKLDLHLFDASGEAAANVVRLPRPENGEATLPEISALANNGGFVVAWQEYDRTAQQTYSVVQKFNSSGSAVGTAFREPGIYTHVDADSQGGWAIVSSINGLTVKTFNSNGALQWSTSFSASVNQNGVEDDNMSLLSLKNGNVAVAWTNSDFEGVWTLLSADGKVLVEPIVFDSTVYGLSLSELSDGSWTLSFTRLNSAWGQPRHDTDVMQLLFEADGTEVFGSRVAVYGTGKDDNLIHDYDSAAMFGFGGRDTLHSALSHGYVDGGSGVDTVDYAGADGAVSVDLAKGEAHLVEQEDAWWTDAIRNIENINGTQFADVLRGNASDNVFQGGVGADVLNGGAGNDTYKLAADLSDSIFDSSGTDTITSTVTRSLASYSTIENLVLESSGNANGTGNGLNNFITGNSGANRLTGEGGKDQVSGGAGNDKLYGGADNDELYGNDGSDYIVGGAGNDRIGGGGGNDTFFFDTALSSRTNIDVITDLTNNKQQNDVIWLDNAIFAGIALGELEDAAFKDRSLGRVDGSDRLLYYQDSGELWYDRDGSGTAYTAAKIAVIENHAKLTADDFFLV